MRFFRVRFLTSILIYNITVYLQSTYERMAQQTDTESVQSWFERTPGLRHEVEFLAWVNQAFSPILIVAAQSITSQCIPVIVKRSIWDSDDARNVGLQDPGIREAARAHFSTPEIDGTTRFLCFMGLGVAASGYACYSLVGVGFSSDIWHVHESVFTQLSANEYAAERVRRELEFKDGKRKLFVRLQNLNSARLNGREGELLEKSRNDDTRLSVVIDGKLVDVSRKKIKLINRSKLLKEEFV